jgi:hypothetical protein
VLRFIGSVVWESIVDMWELEDRGVCRRSCLSIGMLGAWRIRPLPWKSTGPLAVELGVWWRLECSARWSAKGSFSRSLDARTLRRSECLAFFFSRDRDRDLRVWVGGEGKCYLLFLRRIEVFLRRKIKFFVSKFVGMRNLWFLGERN